MYVKMYLTYIGAKDFMVLLKPSSRQIFLNPCSWAALTQEWLNASLYLLSW